MEEVKFNDNKKKKQLVIKQKSGENKNTGEFTLYEAGAHFNYKDLYFKLEKISKDKKVVGQVNQINLGNYLFHNNFETHNSKSKHKLVNLKNQRNEKNDNLKKNNTLNNKEKVNVILPLISSLANSFDSTSITVENKKKDSFKGIVEKYTITEACRPNFGRNNILNSKFNTLPVKSTRNMNTNVIIAFILIKYFITL